MKPPTESIKTIERIGGTKAGTELDELFESSSRPIGRKATERRVRRELGDVVVGGNWVPAVVVV
jgi:hypothetical protein